MRVSTASSFMSGVYDMQSLQSSLQKLQLQLDTQKRVVTPADDPVAAARVLQLSQSDGRNTQFIANSQAVESSLSISETSLTNASNLLTNLKSLAIQAGDGALATTQLQMIQKQVQEGISEMAGYANATDGRGNYLFSGNKISSAAYVVDSNYNATYQGDTGQRDVQISAARQMQISEAGSLVFGDTSSPTAVFDVLKKFNDLLGQSPKPATYASDLSSIMSGIDSVQKNVLTGIASIGARRQENDNVKSMDEDLKLQYRSSISDLQDLDVTKAISDFTMTQNSLKYSQLTYSKVTALSLFNYIS